MPKLSQIVDGTYYECRPLAKGENFYVFWSERGRSRRKTTGTRSPAIAQAFFNEFVKYASASSLSDVTVRDLWTLKYANGAARYQSCWRTSLEAHFGHLKPSEITTEVEDAYKRSRDVAPSTLRLELSLIRAVVAHGVRKKLVSSDDLPELDALPEASKPRERWLSEFEVAKLLKAAEDEPRYRLFIQIALETGARRTAIQDLTWDQVDWPINTIHFLPEGGQQTRKRKPSVPISARLRPVLLAAYEARGSRFVIGPGGRVNKGVARIAKKAGVARVTPHVFRHTAATRMARNGVPLAIVAQVLGNTLEQVEKVYAHWQPQMLQGAVDSISERKSG